MQYEGAGAAVPYDDPFADSDSDEQLWKPMWVSKQVRIVDTAEIFETFNANWLKWPNPSLLGRATRQAWGTWRPLVGMEGEVIHEWRPFHIDATQRSHIDKVILLVQMSASHHLLVREQGVREV